MSQTSLSVRGSAATNSILRCLAKSEIASPTCDRNPPVSKATFSRETAEKVRLLVHGEARPVRTVPLDVFALS